MGRDCRASDWLVQATCHMCMLWGQILRKLVSFAIPEAFFIATKKEYHTHFLLQGKIIAELY
jgi:hypothetical protein